MPSSNKICGLLTSYQSSPSAKALAPPQTLSRRSSAVKRNSTNSNRNAGVFVAYNASGAPADLTAGVEWFHQGGAVVLRTDLKPKRRHARQSPSGEHYASQTQLRSTCETHVKPSGIRSRFKHKNSDATATTITALVKSVIYKMFSTPWSRPARWLRGQLRSAFLRRSKHCIPTSHESRMKGQCVEPTSSGCVT